MGIRGMTMMSITALLVICIGSSQAFRLDSRIPASRIPNSCVTGTGSTCVFPFKYKGVEYYQCTYAESPLPWCATLTDSSGVVVTGQWGDCQISSSSSCTTDSGPQSGQSCVFPFRYNGVVYTTCTTEGQTQAWCSTSVDTAGDFQAGQYGFCPSSCPSTGTTTTTPTTTTTTPSSTTTTTASSTSTTTMTSRT